jgi:hypothetical protein
MLIGVIHFFSYGTTLDRILVTDRRIVKYHHDDGRRPPVAITERAPGFTVAPDRASSVFEQPGQECA